VSRDDATPALARAAFGAWSALVALEIAWHGFIVPSASRWPVLALAVLPLALPLLALSRGTNRALLIASIAVLPYFCHGIMELVVDPSVRGLAAAEVALSAALVIATGTIGMIGRRRTRRIA
jgi:uncharacterized membrane protein